MTPSSPTTLHLLCDKIASGKSTLASHLAKAGGSVLISEEQFALICRYFVAPQADEGLHIVVHPAA